MKIFKLFLLQINIFFFLNSISIASNNFKIITKVGNEIITSFELENKIKISLFLAGINIFGGFLVTKRMLAMFQKS